MSVALLALVAGCSGMDRRAEPVEADQARLVARDFVSALTQLRGFTPGNTTLQVRPPATAFGEELANELRGAGFGMQMVPEDDSGPLLVSYDMEAFDAGAAGAAGDAGRSVGYRLRVGSIELGREYEVRGGRVFPMTALSVRGTRISESPLDDSIFDRNLASEAAASEPVPAMPEGGNASPGDAPSAEPSILLPPLDDDRSTAAWQEVPTTSRGDDESMGDRSLSRWQAVPTAPRRAEGESAPEGAVPDDGTKRAGTRERTPIEWGPQDVLALGGKAFAPVATGYAIDEQAVLMFADDSTRLPKADRPRLESLVASFDPETEVITVLGASHGPTAEPGRNRALAIGRADRVRVELLALGVAPDKVLEEGSWSLEKSPGPDRGVIVSVHRRNEATAPAGLTDRQDT